MLRRAEWEAPESDWESEGNFLIGGESRTEFFFLKVSKVTHDITHHMDIG